MFLASMTKPFCSETDSKVTLLRTRLAEFYNTSQDYDAFSETNWKPEFWKPIRETIERFVAETGTCSVLEFGAGRTGFAEFLGPLRQAVRFDVQDITRLNSEHLTKNSDRVLFCSLTEIREQYDIIFSTFVWEHLTQPRASLSHILSLLSARGVLFLASPRYDFPFYVSPSIRHKSRPARMGVAAWLMWRRALARVLHRSEFLIHTDPALFYRSWFRDADAIHWVSRWDLRCSLSKDWVLRDIKIPPSGMWHWFWSRFLILFVSITRKHS